jgi:hypothetical protein
MFPVRYDLRFYITADGILHSYSREKLKLLNSAVKVYSSALNDSRKHY